MIYFSLIYFTDFMQIPKYVVHFKIYIKDMYLYIFMILSLLFDFLMTKHRCTGAYK